MTLTPETITPRLALDGLTHDEITAVLQPDRPIRFADPEEAMAAALRIMERDAEALRLMARGDEFDAALQWVIDTDDAALRGLADK